MELNVINESISPVVGSGRGRKFDCIVVFLVLCFQALLCKVVLFTNMWICDQN